MWQRRQVVLVLLKLSCIQARDTHLITLTKQNRGQKHCNRHDVPNILMSSSKIRLLSFNILRNLRNMRSVEISCFNKVRICNKMLMIAAPGHDCLPASVMLARPHLRLVSNLHWKRMCNSNSSHTIQIGNVVRGRSLIRVLECWLDLWYRCRNPAPGQPSSLPLSLINRSIRLMLIINLLLLHDVSLVKLLSLTSLSY